MHRRMQKTNQQVLKEIMSFSRYGALAEAFVMDAITQHAERIAKVDPDQASINSPLVSPQAWIGVAREVKTKLDAHFGHRDDAPRESERLAA